MLGRTVSIVERLTRVPRLWGRVWNSNPRPVKSYIALQTVRHHFNSDTSSYVSL